MVINNRTAEVKKNILASMGLKLISILISLQLVPLTIGYINSTRYGIWLTISSIIGWLAYFDLGFGNGFRNKFAESLASSNDKLARKYVSTTYAVLIIIFTLVLFLALSANLFIDWASLLKLNKNYSEELSIVFQLLACFFCINVVCSIINTMLTADQKPALASALTTTGQLVAFISVYILTKTTEGSLAYLACAYSGLPCLFLLLISFLIFNFTRYKKYSPSLKEIDFSLAKNIVKLGVEFFLLMVSALVIFQCINIILTRQVGAEAVTQYNIAYQYMNVIYMLFSIVLTPIWSAVTNAYTLGDFAWIKRTRRKLEILFALFSCGVVIMVLLAPFVYKIWIGDVVVIDYKVTVGVGSFVIMHMFAGTYLYIINGIGKLRVQIFIYLPFVFISLPIMNYMCNAYGIVGCIAVPSLVYFIQAVLAKVQVDKLINGTASGIWNK